MLVAPRRRDSWVGRLTSDVKVIHASTATSHARLSAAAPRLMDSIHRPELCDLLDRLDPRELRDDPCLAYATGRRHVLAGRFEEAMEWFAYVRSSAPTSDPRLLARTSFEMGCIHLERGEVTAAELIAEWDDPAVIATQPDLAHLRALILESRGLHAAAERAYRAAVAARRQSLTPHTAVLALRNFAAMLCHRAPEEAIGLCGLAVALTQGFLLDPGLQPSIRNVMCYALLCGARIDDAVEMGTLALNGAQVQTNARVRSYARFNLAIASELNGEVEAARSSLREIADESSTEANTTIAEWARVRLAWLACLAGAADAPDHVAIGPPVHAAPAFADSVATLRALVAFRCGEFAIARDELTRLAALYLARCDEMTAFVLYLWVARIELTAGRQAAARRAYTRAMSLAMARGFRVSPNWWSDELVDTAGSLADPQTRPYAEMLVRSRTALVNATGNGIRVGVLPHSGELLVDDAPLLPRIWQRGRTGQRVLRRFVSALALARPMGLHRDDLADLLWPESDGDRALNNLYAATYDLRQVLAHVPGLALVVEAQRYRFRADPLVAFLDDDPSSSANRQQQRRLAVVR